MRSSRCTGRRPGGCTGSPVSGTIGGIGRVTGEGIAGNIRQHYSPWLLRVIVALLLIANTLNLGADLGAMGAALRLLIGGSAHLYVVIFAVGCALLEVFSRYAEYVRILKWTTLSLFAYVATALVVKVPWGQVAFATASRRQSAGAADRQKLRTPTLFL